MNTIHSTLSNSLNSNAQNSSRQRRATIQALMAARGFHEPAVLLNCTQSYDRLSVKNDITIAEAFRRAWTCKPLQQGRVPRVAICHIRGLILKVYSDLVWEPEDLSLSVQEALRAFPPVKWVFSGNDSRQWPLLLGSRLDEALFTQRGMANPVRYINCDLDLGDVSSIHTGEQVE